MYSGHLIPDTAFGSCGVYVLHEPKHATVLSQRRASWLLHKPRCAAQHQPMANDTWMLLRRPVLYCWPAPLVGPVRTPDQARVRIDNGYERRKYRKYLLTCGPVPSTRIPVSNPGDAASRPFSGFAIPMLTILSPSEVGHSVPSLNMKLAHDPQPPWACIAICSKAPQVGCGSAQ